MTGDEKDSWQDHAEELGGEPLETQQLDLSDEEERLPWLESSEDEDWGEYEGTNTGRLLGLVVMGLVALAAIVGGIWWATHRTPDPALVADGSTIEAPGAPYKEAPKDPGGKTFDGTGDSSFAVSEGQNRPAQLGGAPAVPASAAPAAAPAGAKAGAAPAAAPAAGGVGVQVGAFSSQSTAEAGWSKLVGQAGGALSGVPHRVVAGSADIGTVYRLQAVAPDSSAANALCSRLKSAGISCQVK
ncbi:SPOR domain-containing protein [Novosphingobium sp. B 225]|uniref:SPOR domain-containing protein n=1 Tax=Novosphingobium sp. B 225 TaxID=1961849 RepID=UPI000B4A6F0F|nr:SPOR domain-containing protein [Novosphingobium sp. B 225]